eukprot:UN00079
MRFSVPTTAKMKLLKNDTYKVMTPLFRDIKPKVCELSEVFT